jgi:hypothetical protein
MRLERTVLRRYSIPVMREAAESKQHLMRMAELFGGQREAILHINDEAKAVCTLTKAAIGDYSLKSEAAP